VSTSLGALRRMVRNRLGLPGTDSMQRDEMLDDVINQAVAAVDAEQRWPWSERVDTVTVPAAAGEFTPDDRWRATKTIVYNGVELAQVALADLLAWHVESGGVPRVWGIKGSVVALRPVVASDVAVTHVWYAQAPTLVDDNDTVDLPDQFAGVIVAKAAELASLREDDRGAAAAHLADYENWIRRMRRDVRRTTGPIRVRVRPGGWLE
jgi:hypothetical protein